MRWLRTALVAVGRRVRPSREFAPAGDLLSCAHKKVGKESAPDRTARSKAAGSLRCSGLEAPRGTRFATLRSDNRAKSVEEVRCAHGLKPFRSSAGSEGECKYLGADGFRVWLLAVPALPFKTAEKRRSPGRERSEPQLLTSRPFV